MSTPPALHRMERYPTLPLPPPDRYARPGWVGEDRSDGEEAHHGGAGGSDGDDQGAIRSERARDEACDLPSSWR